MLDEPGLGSRVIELLLAQAVQHLWTIRCLFGELLSKVDKFADECIDVGHCRILTDYAYSEHDSFFESSIRIGYHCRDQKAVCCAKMRHGTLRVRESDLETDCPLNITSRSQALTPYRQR